MLGEAEDESDADEFLIDFSPLEAVFLGVAGNAQGDTPSNCVDGTWL